ncbi:unnamed protein product [Symbiodinium necroappetens]|uniref:Uncharacterized protein n=1 Tax=Symbiodinium necroappetens TaxID=1628268 RepID=A0A812P6T5_9DINO|nr:unnamed protein product [Symbiodinium necroappetens]
MNGLHEQVDDSVSSQRLLKKATEDEVIEDEFNIHSTVGLVSALLLSCLASTVSDSKDLKDFAEERDRRWELQDDGVSIFDVYQALIFVSMSCNVLAIMTSIARLIAFQRVAKSNAPEFQEMMAAGRAGWCAGALPVVAMAVGVISYIFVMLIQGYLVMKVRTLQFCIATITVCSFLWGAHESWIFRAKRAVNHPELVNLSCASEYEVLECCESE